jgi:hypothetical protein
LIDPRATALWESIYSASSADQRPARLDNTDGIASSKLIDADALVAVANSIKDDLDVSKFVPEHVGAEVSI